ncbi:PREDICTED: uncharacterized protein LOC104824626 isoform X5 [Tarenaya hassleriana]|uniref:uncharacterized protein LOC104824626 isoform X5 n=1 Tax=Tarenaya hassleriana TaxID=28532 RepID=UPI00053C7AA8|nr:PREDICTED: uncharacterized protein LOC104824626 isoform X5 [Tarenaya hassleriana]
MESEQRDELAGFLQVLPPVEFCCVYGSALHPNNHDKSKMVDYILGVSDPEQWHSEVRLGLELFPLTVILHGNPCLLCRSSSSFYLVFKNLRMNSDHYASWMVNLGGARLISGVADKVGVGVHFNPFVTWNNRMLKYGVVRMHNLVQDILNWDRFYLSGRLQKPVHILVDGVDIANVNSVNLRAAISAALLLLPSNFTERTEIRWRRLSRVNLIYSSQCISLFLKSTRPRTGCSSHLMTIMLAVFQLHALWSLLFLQLLETRWGQSSGRRRSRVGPVVFLARFWWDQEKKLQNVCRRFLVGRLWFQVRDRQCLVSWLLDLSTAQDTFLRKCGKLGPLGHHDADIKMQMNKFE